ncbi:hypothetical protein [Maribacter halichondriae]|uniref:hypothetical protein n=1 Tax=Maribacter halichondriae TaxID=2980554 RepID=UPI002359227F|nr:hypothetical protein [Maribacter sp. Hal144]
MIWGISLVLLSIIAVPSLILSKKPNAKELLAKIEPYQGWIGIVFCFLGVWGVITAILNLNWLSLAPIWWVTILLGNLVSATLGFMLGSGLINKLFLSNNESAKAKAEEFREKLAPKQGKLGLLGIAVGVWMVVASFLFTIA